MNKITQFKRKTKGILIIFLAVLFILLLNFGIHMYYIHVYNQTERVTDSSSTATDVFVDIHPRGQTTDTWEKDNAFPDVILNAQIYEATIINGTSHTVRDWKLRVNIAENCYLNNAWCGTVEVHQFISGMEKIQQLDLRDYDVRDITLSYYMAGQDLLIPLKEGDYIIYYPDDSTDSGETPIKAGSEYAGQASIGLIFYSLTGNVDLSSYELSYYIEKSYFTGKESVIFLTLFPIWGLAMLVFLIITVITTGFQKRLQKNKEMITEALDVFSNFVDAKDPYTNGHSRRVAEYSRQIARKLGMSETECDNVYFIALVHDIGKCYVPDEILKKPSKLTYEEFEIIKTHTVKGAKMLENFKSLPNISDGAMYHHERFDGKGYPTGKSGEEIPFIGRLICVADSYDAMNSNRVYRNKLSGEQIMEELIQNKGTQFDPVVVDAFIEVLKENQMMEEENRQD